MRVAGAAFGDIAERRPVGQMAMSAGKILFDRMEDFQSALETESEQHRDQNEREQPRTVRYEHFMNLTDVQACEKENLRGV
jgi:hypothetical protein